MKTKIRIGWMILTLVLLGMLAMTLPAMAQVTISASTTLTQADTNLYAGQTVTVTGSGTILTVETASVVGQLAEYQFGNLIVTNGAVILCRGQTNSPYLATQRGVALAVSGNVFVDATSSIHADGQGFTGVVGTYGVLASGRGPGAGRVAPYVGVSSGAGFGGAGGDATNSSGVAQIQGGLPYGTAGSPLSLGSGGAGYYDTAGGSGGGALKLTVSGTLTVNGALSANGTVGSGGRAAGGGSGGSIWIAAGVLQGTGVVRCVGGNGLTSESAGGGGGRIDVSGVTVAGSAFFTGGGTFNVSGGTPVGAGQSGGAGTIKFPASLNLTIDNTGAAGLRNLTLGPNVESGAVDESLYTFPLVTVKANSSLTLSGNKRVANGGSATVPSGQGVTINAGNIDVQSSGTITATGKGFDGSVGQMAGWGPGGGGYNYGDSQGAGGGFGGSGGSTTNTSSGANAVGGISYWGSASAASNQPTALGSGGGCSYGDSLPGGSGGGGIKLVVSTNLICNGSITANGSNGGGTRATGGGSGGSIYISATGTISGAGSISANGGNAGTSNKGGGGGGGRVHIVYGGYSLPANPTVNGGTGYGTGGSNGMAGTLIMYKLGATPAIDQGESVTTNISEDAGTIVLTNLVSATDTDSTAAQLSWTNTTTPANGTVACSGTGTNPATLTYTPYANFNGTNSFLVRVMDEGGRTDSITVTVVVAAINDPPLCTVRPAVSGVLVPGQLLTADTGTWSDAADTNVSGSATLSFAYEWQYSTTNDGTGVTSLGVYGTQYTVAAPATAGKYVRVQVTCTNDGVGTPQYQVVVTNSAWGLIVSGNALPVINQGSLIATNMAEDGGTLQLTNLVITASDADGDNLTWTNTTSPNNGTVSVSGTGTNPVTWAAFTYTPATNFYGTNSFLVQASDGNGGTASITVEVAVAAMNDAPVNTGLPGISGMPVYPNTLTATNGVWNDNADTNAAYTHDNFTNTAAFSYQWWRADNGSGLNSNSLAGATAQSYGLTKADRYKWLRVAVTCTDAGVGTPANQSVTAWSPWLQETSTVPTTVTFTNALGDGAWGSYSNWSPDTVPQATIAAIVGDANVKSPVAAAIGVGETAATAALTLGKNTRGSGTLNINGGTLAGGGGLVLGNDTSSTGLVNLAGGARMTGYSDLYIGNGVGAVGKIVVDGGSVFSNSPNLYINVGSGQNSDGTLEVKDGAFWADNGNRTWKLGFGAGSVGRLTVTGGRLDVASGQGAVAGYNSSGTGIVTVAGGTMSAGALWIGQAEGAAAGDGYVYVTNTGTLSAGALYMGYAARSNAYLRVDGSATCTAARLVMGSMAGNVSVVDLKGGASTVAVGNSSDAFQIGSVAGATGVVIVAGGTHVWTSSGSGRPIGNAAGSLGRVTIAGGSLSTSGDFAYGYYGVGELSIAGGAMTNSSGLYLGYMAGGLGRMTVTGGTWSQVGALGIGSAAAGVTGMVTVANGVQTNITGAVTVGGGSTAGDRYGSLMITNATFGGGTAVSVWTNGFVELMGTGSTFRCSTFTCRGGSLTNHVRQFAGGLDVTGSTLTVTNGGKVYLSFDEGPASGVSGHFWGLRWAGNSHAADLAALTNQNVLSWGGAAAAGVGIYTNATHTMVGYFINTPPVVTNAGKAVTINMSEDGSPTNWAAVALGAADAEGDTLTWTNGAVGPAHGTVSVINVVSSNLTTYTYTPATNWNGTDSFTVEVRDGRGGVDTGTVTVIVAPVDDPPVCTAAPTVSGLFQNGQTVSNDNLGTWNDAIDTNVSGSSTLTFTRQWQRADDGAGLNAGPISGATNLAYTFGLADTGKYVRVAVTCADDGVGTGAPQSVTTNTAWTLVTAINHLPVITNGAGPLVVTLPEDCGATNLLAALNLGATDEDSGEQATLSWTNSTVPAGATVAISGTGANPAVVLYTPDANFYGTNTFTVRVTDTPGGFDDIVVEVHVTAVNDPPANTMAPGIAGTRLAGNTLTATNGVWNDDVDTNATYTAATFASGATFGYQWWRADNGSGLNSNTIANATNQTYALTKAEDRTKWLRVAVTCTDAGVPGNASTTAWSSWLQETSTVPTTVTFTNALGDSAWGSYANWAPDWVPQATMAAILGDANVKSPVVATIGVGETAATAALTLGKNTGGSGTLNINGGTLAGGGNLVLGDESSSLSTGTVSLAGGARMTGYPDVYVGRGAGAVGKIVVDGGSVFSNVPNVCVYIGAGQNSDGAVEVKNGTFWAAPAANRTVKVAYGAGSVGRLTVTGGMLDTAAAGGTCVGFSTNGTGIVSVAGGTLNVSALLVGYGDGGPAGQGSVHVTNNGTLNAGGISMGWAAASNAYMLVDNSATVNSFGEYLGLRMGFLAGNVSMLDLKGGTTTLSCGNHVDTWGIGVVSGSTGIVSVTGGNHTWASAHSEGCSLGFGAGAVGKLTLSGGSLTVNSDFYVGRSGYGEVLLSGGAMTSSSGLYLGYMAGGQGRMTVTGGTWSQVGALGIGSAAAGVTGVVTVANCVQSNIAGAVTVGGGSPAGDRLGTVTISNATFGGTTAVTVWTNGFVELTGTGSVLRCGTLTCKGGSVTNHVRAMSGGLDIADSGAAALTVTNGGVLRLVFEQGPVSVEQGDFWGLRWAGNNHAAALQALTNAVPPRLTWSDSGMSARYQGQVGIYTNSTTTFVGFYYWGCAGTVFTFR